MAAVDFFLKLEGIDGDVTDKNHEKWIEIQSFSWGVTNAVSQGATGGGGAGKAAPADFTLQLPFSSASPMLFQKIVSGQSISDGTLAVASFIKDQATDFLTWKMSDVLITSYQVEGADDGPFEQIALNFTKIEVSYSPPSSTGSIVSPVTAGFDFRLQLSSQ
jgi:type VI secretion system secreted protein Hcp